MAYNSHWADVHEKIKLGENWTVSQSSLSVLLLSTLELHPQYLLVQLYICKKV